MSTPGSGGSVKRMGLLPLEFSDCVLDSPYFRENLRAHEKQLDQTSTDIKGIIKDIQVIIPKFIELIFIKIPPAVRQLQIFYRSALFSDVFANDWNPSKYWITRKKALCIYFPKKNLDSLSKKMWNEIEDEFLLFVEMFTIWQLFVSVTVSNLCQIFQQQQRSQSLFNVWSFFWRNLIT